MAKTFENLVNEVEISLGIQRLLIADFPQSYDGTRIDIATPPTGFYDLGAVVEDTPSLSVTRNKFSLVAGLPQVNQFEAVIGLEGSFELSLHSFSWRKAQFAFGNVAAVSSYSLITTIASVTDRNTITFANTTSVESLALYLQFVMSDTEAGLDAPDATETRVASITDDGLTFFLLPDPINTPSAGDYVAYYDSVCQYYGTNIIRNHVLLAVTDFIDGSQVVHEFFKATPGSETTEEIRPEENQRFPLSFDLLGVSRSDIPGLAGCPQLVVGRRCYFPTIAQC